MGSVVAYFSYYLGNSCDNLGDSLRHGCNNNRYLGLVALVTSHTEEYNDHGLARTDEAWWIRRQHML